MKKGSDPSTTMTPADLAWLVRNRAALPAVALELRRRWSGHPTEPGEGAQGLVGIAFVLWRALPLMPLGSARPSRSADHATQLLYEVIAHNRVTYAEEFKCRDWLVGFYLNLAEERVAGVADILHVNDPKIDYAKHCVANASFRHSLSYRKRWENSLQCLCILVTALPDSSAEVTGQTTQTNPPIHSTDSAGA